MQKLRQLLQGLLRSPQRRPRGGRRAGKINPIIGYEAPARRSDCLEDRIMLTGQLAVQLVDGADTHVLVNPGTDDEIQVFGHSDADLNAAATFFLAPDGAAGTATIDGRIVAGGEEVSGTFTLTEFATGGGVAVEANNISVRLGNAVGIQLSDADGVFVIHSDGFAGQVDVADTGGSDDIEVFGLNGLQLDSAVGLQFEINTTDAAVDRTVSTVGGDVPIDIMANTEQIVGPGEFRVDGVLGPVAKTNGALTITENAGDEGNLTIGATNVRATLAVGDVNAATVASQTATFSLGVDVDSDTGAETPAFRLDGNSFVVGGFVLLPNGSEAVDPTNGGVGGRAVLTKASLGPLSLSFVGMALPNFQLVGDQFSVEAGIDASFDQRSKASLSFNDPDVGRDDPNPLAITASKPKGSIEIRGNVGDDGLVDTALLPGKFTLAASSVTLVIPEILEAKASGSPTFIWDPSLGLDQEIFKTNRLDIEIEPVEVKGQFLQTAENPALLVRGDGFAFGRGTVTLDNFEQDIGDFATIVNPFVRLTDLTFSVDDGISLGEFAVGAAEVRLGSSGGLWSVEGQSVTASVTLTDSFFIDDIKFTVGSLVGKLGTHLEFSASNTTFKPTASGDEELLRVAGAIGVAVKAGPVDVSGSMSRFAIQADGDFKPLENFKVTLGVGLTKAEQLLWPKFIPLQIDEIGVRWPNFEKDPGNFQLLFSGGVNGTLPANVASLTGTVKGLIVDGDKLISGEFPIVAVEEVAVSARGEFLGGSISGGLFMGVIKLDEEGNRLPDGASTFDDTVIYAGIQGGFDFPSLGKTDIRIALSEFGPLSAYISAGIPITIDPIFTGLTVTELRGGITFNATPIQPPDNPSQLVGAAFKPQTKLTFEQWKERAIQQVANLATGGSGFIFDHTDNVNGFISDLNNGSVSGGSSFEASFKDRGFPIGNALKRLKVETIDFGKKWHISIGDQHYIAEVKGELSGKKLRVSAVNFTPEISIADELTDGGKAPQSLVDAFSKHRVRLDTDFDVAVTKRATNPDGSDGAPIKWTLSKPVSNGDVREYFIEKHSGDGGLLSVTGNGGVFEDLGLGDFRVEFGATLYSAFITDSAFKADVDITMTSDSKYVLSGNFTFGEKFSADTRAFIDFGVADPQAEIAPRIVMLADFPGASTGLPRVARLQGDVFFEFRDENGEIVKANTRGIEQIRSFTLRFLGRGELTAVDVAKIVVGGDSGSTEGFGELAATFSVDPDVVKFQLDVKGSIGVEGLIPADDLVSGAGQLVFEVPTDGESPELYGGLKLDFGTNEGGLSFLADAGLEADAEIALVINATNQVQQIDLALPGRPIETFFLEALTLGLEMQGSLMLGQSIAGFGAQLVFDGVFSATVRIDENVEDDPFDDTIDFELFMAALLEVDAQAAGQNLNLMTMDAMGVFVARDVGPFNLVPDLAGRIDLVSTRGIPGVIDITTGTAPATLQFNTTGLDQTYVVPERLRDRLAVIQGRRENKDPGDVVIPPTTIQGGQNITIEGTPPPLITGQTFLSGPYFFVNLGGNPLEESDDAGVTLLNTFKLTGDFRFVAAATGGLELIVNARAGIALPGAENIFSANAQGLLRISEPGIVGAITLDADFDIPGVDVEGDVFFAVNTTDVDESVTLVATDGGTSQRDLPARSIEALVRGSLDVLDFELDGEFRLFTEGTDLKLSVDAGLEVFDLVDVRINEVATIATGVDARFDLSGLMNNGVDVEFGEPGVFETKAKLLLNVDTARNVAEIRIDNLELELLGTISLDGRGKISAHRDVVTGESYLRLDGDLQGDFFGIAGFDVDGIYDSRGFIDLDVSGKLRLGSSSFGVSADADFFIKKDETGFLDFGGSANGRVKAFSVSVGGVDLDLDYDTDSGRIRVEAEVSVGVSPFKISKSAKFTVGYLRLGSETFPRLGEKTPLSGQASTLVLNVGERGGNRRVESDATSEQYIISSLGPGTLTGEKLEVRAFGSRQIFDNIQSVTGNFGDNSDELRISENVGTFYSALTFLIDGGAGNDQLVNEGAAIVSFSGGDHDDLLVAGSAPATLIGGSGDDELIGGSAVDVLQGGAGNDQLTVELSSAVDAEVSGGGDTDRLTIIGGDSAETIRIEDGGGTRSDFTFGSTTLNFDTEGLRLFARGGADSITVDTMTLDTLSLSLGRIVDNPTVTGSSAAVDGRDDQAVDKITILGDSTSNNFDVEALGGAVRVTRDSSFTIDIYDETAGRDQLTLAGHSGNDTFTVTGPMDGNGTSPGERLDIRLFGLNGTDTFNTPIGSAKLNGGQGTDTANFQISDGDPLDVVLTDSRITAGTLNTKLGSRGLERVGVDSNINADILIQSTLSNGVGIDLGAGGSLLVNNSSGPIDVNISGDETTVTDVILHRTGAPVTVTGSASADRVRIGTGLISRIGGDVMVNSVDTVRYENSADGQSRAITVDDTMVTGLDNAVVITHTDVDLIEVGLGDGDDVATFNILRSGISIDAGGGTDRVSAVLDGAPSALNPRQTDIPSMLVRDAEFADLTVMNNATATDWLLDVGPDGGFLRGDGVNLLELKDAVELTLDLDTADGGSLQTFRVGQPTDVRVTGSGHEFTIGGQHGAVIGTLNELAGVLALDTTGTGHSLRVDDSASFGADRTINFKPGLITGPNPAGAIDFDAADFVVLDANLGSAATTLNAENIGILRNVTGGAADDTFLLSGAIGCAVIDGADGDDVLRVLPGSGTVEFAGGATPLLGIGDKVIFDHSATAIGLTGSLVSTTADNATITLDMLPIVTLSGDSTESADVLLGEGNDVFTINNAHFSILVDILGAGGDDTFNVQAVNGDADSHRIAGEGGLDTANVTIPGVPTADQFTALASVVDELIVDNSGNSTATHWLLVGTDLQANTLSILDAVAAARLQILGGSSADDTLEVAGTGSTTPLTVTLENDSVKVFDGTGRFSLNSNLDNLQVAGTVDVLTDATNVLMVFLDRENDPTVSFGVGPFALMAQPDGITVLEASNSGLRPVRQLVHPDLNNPGQMVFVQSRLNGKSPFQNLYVEADDRNGDPVLLNFSSSSAGVFTFEQKLDLDSRLSALGRPQAALPSSGGFATTRRTINGLIGIGTDFVVAFDRSSSGTLTEGPTSAIPDVNASMLSRPNNDSLVGFTAHADGTLRRFFRHINNGGLTTTTLMGATPADATALQLVTHLEQRGSNVFAVTSDGRLLTLEIDLGTNTFQVVHELQNGQPDGDGDTVAGLFGVTDFIRSNDQLFLTSETENLLARFSIDDSGASTITDFRQTLIDSGDRRLNGLTAVTTDPFAQTGDLADESIFVVTPTEHAVTQIDLIGGESFGQIRSSIGDGDEVTQRVPGVQDMVVSADGRFVYGISEGLSENDLREDVLFRFDTMTGETSGFLNGVSRQIINPNLLTLSPDDHFIAVEDSGQIRIFEETGAGGLQLRSTTPVPGIRGMQLASNGQLLVLTGDDLIRFSVAADGTISETARRAFDDADSLYVDAGRIYVIKTNNDRSGSVISSVALDDFNGATQTTALDGIFPQVTSTADAVYITQLVEVAGDDVRQLLVFQRSGFAAPLPTVPDQILQNGVADVEGLSIGGDVIADTANGLIFVAGISRQFGGGGEDTVVSFRDTGDGTLEYLQTLRNHVAGIRGLTSPGALAVANNQLFVANPDVVLFSEGPSRRLEFGGFAILDIAPEAPDLPSTRDTQFSGMESLTITTAGQADSITVNETAAIPTIINAGAGDDFVTILSTSTALLTVNGQGGEDRIDINHSDNGALRILPGDDKDVVNVQAVGDGSTTDIDSSGDTGTKDLTLIAQAGLADTAVVNVVGDLKTGDADTEFDALVYSGENAVLTPAGTNGTIVSPGGGSVSFTNFNSPPHADQQVFLIDTVPVPEFAPQPAAGDPVATINEGDDISLQFLDTAGVANFFSWDINGDGQFIEAESRFLNLTWGALKAFGIDDDGQFPITARAANTVDLTDFGFGMISLPADIRGFIQVNDSARQISVTGEATATLGSEFTINLNDLGDPGNDRITGWRINWGDGTIEDLGSDAVMATHSYLMVGQFQITVTAFDDEENTSVQFDGVIADVGGTPTNVNPIPVTPDPATLSMDGPYEIDEGEDLILKATFVGVPARFDWDLDGGGADFTTTEPTLIINWATLETQFGIEGRGRAAGELPDVHVTAVYTDASGTEFPITSDTKKVTVNDVTTNGILRTSVTSVPEGSPEGSVTVTVTDLMDPSTIDLAGAYTVTYRVAGFTLPAAAEDRNIADPFVLPAELLAESGDLIVQAVLTGGGGTRSFSGTLAVTDLLPTVTVVPSATTIDEGGAITLQLAANDPGGDAIASWIIDWGDGAPAQTLAGDATSASQVFPDGEASVDVTVTAVQAEGQVTADPITITVNDITPTVTLSSTSSSLLEGDPSTPFVVNISVADPGDDTVASFLIDWGDGSPLENVPGFATTASKIYADEGSFSITIAEVTNDDGTFSNPSNTINAIIGNVDPLLVPGSLSVPTTGDEAEPIFLSASAFGSVNGSDDLTFEWLVTRPDATTFSVPGSSSRTSTDEADAGPADVKFLSDAEFTPEDDGTWKVQLQITDDDGMTTTSGTTDIIVRNLAPAIDTFTLPGIAKESDTINLSATASDPADQNDPRTFVWKVTNTLSGNVLNLVGATPNFQADGGTYGIELTVNDGDGGTASRAGSLLVSSSAPELGVVVIPATANEVETVSLTATASDGDGTTDGLTFVWNVEQPGGTVEQLAGPNVQFTFPDDGDFIVSVTVTDNEGEIVSSEPQTVTVGNVDPQLTGSNIPGTGIEGTSINLTASATDIAGTRDPLNFLWTITHPDGSESEVGGTSALFTPPDDGTYELTLTVDDNDGGQATVSGQIVVGNADPLINGITIPPLAMEGVEQTLSIDVTDVPGDLDNLQIDWILTNSATGEVSNLSGPQIAFTPGGGNYTVSVNITDGDDGTATASGDIRVFSITVPETGAEGELVNMTATKMDNGGAPLTFNWQVDVEDESAITLTGSDVSFTPDDNGIYTVTLQIDDGINQTTVVRSLQVANVAPRVSLTGPATAFVGEQVVVSVGIPEDPGDDTVSSFLIEWGDGTTTQIAEPGDVTHTYTDPLSANQITLSVTDEDGRHAEVGSLPISINDFALVEFSAETFSVTEAGDDVGLPITLVRTGDLRLASDVTVQLSGIEAAGESGLSLLQDFDATDISVSFAAGVSTATIVVPIIDDSVVELNERLRLTILAEQNVVIGATNTATMSIVENDTAEITIDDVTVTEGDSGSQLVTLVATLNNSVDSPVRVQFDTEDGTATLTDIDFTTAPGELRFSGAASETITFTVEIFGDDTVELDETLSVLLSGIDAEQRDVVIADGEALIHILNDDAATINVADVSGNESQGTLTFTATLSQSVDVAVEFSFDVTGLSAEPGVDFLATLGTIVFEAGSTGPQDIAIAIVDDSRVESVESFSLNISDVQSTERVVSSPTNSAIGTIIDDDSAVSGQKWYDLDNDGVKDGDEPGLDDWLVEIVDESGNSIAEVVTASVDVNGDGQIDPFTERGRYTIEVPAGTWGIRTVDQLGWIQTHPQSSSVAELAYRLDQENNFRFAGKYFENWGGEGEIWVWGKGDWFYISADGGLYRWVKGSRGPLQGQLLAQLNSDFRESPSLLHDALPSSLPTVEVIAGQTTQDTDFGSIPSGIISGRKWNDANTNGERDAGEVWQNGWTIYLMNQAGEILQTAVTQDIDLDGDSQINPETERGWYQFEHLAPGTFQVADQLQALSPVQDAERPFATEAYHLDQKHSFRKTKNDFFNWGERSEKWFFGNNGWNFVTPDGSVFNWDRSPRTALTGNLLGVLNADYWHNPELIYSVKPLSPRRVVIRGQVETGINIGNSSIPSGDAAGNVVAVVDGQGITITGDSLSNTLVAYFDLNSNLLLQGLGETTINGSLDPVTLVTGSGQTLLNANISLGDDNDRILVFDSVDSHESFGNLNINTGAGDDDVQLIGTKLAGSAAITNSGGSDQLRVTETSTGADLIVNSAAVKDVLVAIQRTTAGGDLIVDTNAGADTVFIQNVRVGEVTDIRTSGGDDSLILNGNVHSGTTAIDSGVGNDLIALLDSTFIRRLHVDASDDDDIVGFYGGNRADEDSIFEGGDGVDTLSKDESNTFATTPTEQNFELSDEALLDTLIDLALSNFDDLLLD